MAKSAEPRRRKAYAIDLRWRVVYQRLAQELPYQTIAQNLSIATSTVHRIYTLFEATGDVTPLGQQKGSSALKKLDDHTELYIIGMVMENPALYLAEVCQNVESALGICISPPTICRLLKSYGITRKKIRQVATQRCNLLRGAFLAQCFNFSADKYVWIDETGSDARNHIRKFGYAISGATPVSYQLLSRGKRTNAIAAISTTGVVALELTCNTVNESVFFDFVRGTLIPQMLPFDGINPRSIAVMDNLSVHHVQHIVDLFNQAGILLFFLPTYSPDLNLIEEAFSYVKYYLKKHDELLKSIPDPCPVIKSAFNSITREHCMAWIRHSGYALNV